MFFFLMIRRPPRSTRTDTLFPYTTLFRSFSALVFLALPYVTLHRQHIEVTILTDRFPPAIRRWTDRLANGFIILFAVWFGSYAFDFAFVSYQVQARTDIAGQVLLPWMALIVLACALVAGFALVRALREPAGGSGMPPRGGWGEGGRAYGGRV